MRSFQVAVALLGVTILASAVWAVPTPPREASFVGDAKVRADSNHLDYGRWKGGTNWTVDPAQGVQPAEISRQSFNINPIGYTPAKPPGADSSWVPPQLSWLISLRKRLNLPAPVLKPTSGLNPGQTDPNFIAELRQLLVDMQDSTKNPGGKDAADALKLLLSKIPTGSAKLPDDLHPIEYIGLLRQVSDKDSLSLMPPRNHIQIVATEGLKQMPQAAKDALVTYEYRTVTTTTHTLRPVYTTISTYWPT